MLTRRLRCVGAATVEFHVVTLFALLPLCLGMLQLALLLTDNHHVDHATFQAVRRAAMEQGDLDSARRAFAQSASVLFVDAASELDKGNAVARVTNAYVAAFADQLRYARFRVNSPSPDAQVDFAVTRGTVRVIPNDGLQYRASTPGRRSGETIQQANVLRVEVTWCRPLIVPFARQMLLGLLRVMDRDPWHQYCYSEGRVPIRSESASPMQSDFRVSS